MNSRYEDLLNWYFNLTKDTTIPVLISGDASFRKFYRTNNGILMDAPPSTEKNKEFVSLSKLLRKNDVHVPEIYAVDYEKGFLLVEDLGDNTLASIRSDENRLSIYKCAIDYLKKISQVNANELNIYDKDFIVRENLICHEWCFEKSLKLALSNKDKAIISDAENIMVLNDLEQPQIAVHRDYHSRNIMCLNNCSKVLCDKDLALVDFQDMVKGPFSYDLVSLLKDCYYKLPQDELKECLEFAYMMYLELGIITNLSYSQFERYFDITGLQRHYKCLGIFNRLAIRDGKDKYMKDLPLVKEYIMTVTQKYDELHDFSYLIERYVK